MRSNRYTLLKEKEKMRKIIIFSGILAVLIAGVALYFYIDFKNSSRTQNSLSDRAKEFLQEQKTRNNSLTDINLKGRKIISQDISVEKCFSFHIPFSVRNVNTDNNGNPCYRYVSFDNPKGSVVIYKESSSGLDLDSAPGVSLRRLKKDVYKEESFSITGHSFLVFRDTTKPYEKTAYTLVSGSYIITTLSVTDPEVPEEKFKMLLASIQVK